MRGILLSPGRDAKYSSTASKKDHLEPRLPENRDLEAILRRPHTWRAETLTVAQPPFDIP